LSLKSSIRVVTALTILTCGAADAPAAASTQPSAAVAATPAAPKAPPPEADKPYKQDIPGSTITIDMVPIPAGEFKPEKGDAVKVKPLFMSKYEITWDSFDIFAFQLDMTDKEKAAGVDAKSRPSRPYGAPDHGFGHHNYAAIHITRYAAEQFCLWLSKKTGRTYRLPTEAEWTYACRAGGDGKVEALDKVAWYWDNSDDKTHPVGQKEPNAWGLYDMLGNAAEYVTIPGEPANAKPTACGGSYDDKPEDVHCGARKTQNPDWNSTDPQNPKSKWWLSDGPFVGFRVICEP
jgi:formylglycine-generating enzyme required for sulfatase activity